MNDPVSSVLPRDFIGDLLWVTTLLAAAWGWGRLLLRRGFKVQLPAAEIPLGLGALAALGMMLGLLGLFRDWAVVLIWLPGVAWLMRDAKELKTRVSFSRPLAALGLLAVFNLLYAYAPPVSDDSEYIYLALPRLYAQAGALIEVPQNPHAYFPSAVEMLYTQLMVLGTPLAPRLLAWACGLGASLLAGVLAAEAFSLPALETALALYAMPWMVSLSGSGKIDPTALVFALAAMAAYLAWRKDRDTRTLLLSALLAGAHSACKLTGPSFAIGLAACVAWDERGRKDGRPWLAAMGFLAVSALPALPWYARNWILRSNPLYPAPFLGLPADTYLSTYVRVGQAGQPLDSLSALAARTWDQVVVADGIWGTGPWLWAFLPFALAALTPLGSRFLLAAGIQIVITWAAFKYPPGPRFIAPALALLAPLALAGARDSLAAASPSLRRAFTAVFWCAIIGQGLALSAFFGLKRLPLFLGRVDQTEFLERKWSRPEEFSLMEAAWDKVPEGEGILFLFPSMSPSLYYPKNPTAGLAAYPVEFYREPAEAAFPRLKKDGWRWLVVVPSEYRTRDGRWTMPQFELTFGWLDPASLKRYAEPVFEGARSTLYRIR